MPKERFYKILASDPNISLIEDVIIGTIKEQRWNNALTELYVMIPKEDKKNYNFLAKYNQRDCSFSISDMDNSEWHNYDVGPV